MGNVDTVRRVVTTARAIRGKDSAPGSLYWYHLLDYILYQSFRVHQHSSIEGAMKSIKTHKRFLRDRKRNRSYRGYLYRLVNGLTAAKMDRYFPGLQAHIDHMQPESITTLSSTEMNEATGAIQPSHGATSISTSISPADGYKQLAQFLDSTHDLYTRRLNSSLPHFPDQSTNTESTGKDKEGKDKERRKRGTCILCCSLCDVHANKPTSKEHYRMGRKTVDYCYTCKVYLCKKCFGTFHNDIHPTISLCCSGLDRSSRSRKRSHSSSSSPVHSSPTMVSRKQRKQRSQGSTRAPSSPRGTISAQLRGRTKHPSATSPTQQSPSPKRRRRTAEMLDESSASPLPEIRRRTEEMLNESSDRRVRPRVLYPPSRGSDLSSPPKVSRSKQLGWRALLPWSSKR